MRTTLRICTLALAAAAATLSLNTWAQSDAALASASKEAGAQVTKSGLVYLSLKNGTGASPAAGPLIVTYDPPRKGSRNPAMIADMIPHTGGAPDVIAIPIENGREIIDTIKPDVMS